MSQFQYFPLSLEPDSIRLLHLLPSDDENAPIQCQLFDYSLQKSSKQTHQYDALSYVWGDSEKSRSIYIDKYSLPITENLYVALLHLRNLSYRRFLWTDAICIDQSNVTEKEQQIPFMAKIYGQANRVLVWLGPAADNSDQAVEEIRAAGGSAITYANNETIQSAVLALLQRKWFQRIWVLQEVAAARHVLIMCGPTEIDGYAFCLGTASLMNLYKGRADLQTLIRSVTYLIRGAIFRPRNVSSGAGGAPEAICTLGELIDMYHTHEATKRHDKVYALLGMTGMSYHDLSKANLLPNYGDPWQELLERLVKFVLGERISVEAWDHKEIAVIRSKGCIFGSISSVYRDIAMDGRQGVHVVLQDISEELGYKEEYRSTYWTLYPSPNPVRDGDLICLLQGASTPTIIRLRKDHFVIIMITASPLENGRTESRYIERLNLLQPEKVFTRDFLLVWDWEYSRAKLQVPGEYDTFTQINGLASEHPNMDSERDLAKATRIWNAALVVGDAGEHGKADTLVREAIESRGIVYAQKDPQTLEIHYGLTPLSWAAGNGYGDIVKSLIAGDGVDLDLKDSKYGRTPLSWAAGEGHEAVVKLLVETGKVLVNSKDNDGRPPLSWAARNGHVAVVKLLLVIYKFTAESEDWGSETALLWAAKNGHEAIANLLLATGKVDADWKNNKGQTALLKAAKNGHEAIANLLLATGKVDADWKNNKGQTALSQAAGNGHQAVVKLLLTTGKVNAESKDLYNTTALSWAARNGHEDVVKLLLATGKVNTELADWDNTTALSWAARNGHEDVVKLLLATGKVNTESADWDNMTALSWAARNGHEDVVKLLLATGKVNTESADWDNMTALLWAARNGHQAVVKLLLTTGKVNAESKDLYNTTALSWAARNGHEDVVKLLLATGKVNTESADLNNITALSWAARNGHQAVVKLLQENTN